MIFKSPDFFQKSSSASCLAPLTIAICVDGTSSEKNRPSAKHDWVYEFYKDVRADVKIFSDGPNDVLTGEDWFIWIEYKILDWLVKVGQFYNVEIIGGNMWRNYSSYNTKINIIMIGHSRGGLIVMDIAKKLNFRTSFMGLFDAVNMIPLYSDLIYNDPNTIINVLNIAHARRSASENGRWYFGNTGTKSGDGGKYIEKFFNTSHAGINGDVATNIGVPLASDNSCAIVPNIPKQSNIVIDTLETMNPLVKIIPILVDIKHNDTVQNSIKCIDESIDSNNWMRTQAKNCSVII